MCKMDPGIPEDHLMVNLPHHIQHELCTTRATYRQGKKLTAVKVYTVNQESQHLLIYRVPQINLRDELRALCERYGKLGMFYKLELVQPEEAFTDNYHVSYSKMHNARKAKRFLDGRSFYGGLLHVCYAPELETIDETRIKLINRRNEIAYFTGRRLKVPRIDTKRKASVSRDLHRNKMLRRAPPKTKPLNGDGTSLGPGSTSAVPNSLGATTLPPFQSPNVTWAEGFAVPGTSISTFVGPGGLPSYPSQQILELPGQEIKKARDQKFMPTSVLKRTKPSSYVSTSTNKIIFHKKHSS